MPNFSDESDESALTFSADEFLYEYLERKPAFKLFFAFSVTVACIFGLIANSAIAYMKLRNFASRSPFDLLIATVAIGLNLLSMRFILMMIEETTHDIVNLPTCYAARIFMDTATPIIILSLVAVMILIKYYPNVNKQTELKIVAGIVIFTAIIAFPFYNIAVVQHQSWDHAPPHGICVLHFSFDEANFKYLLRLWVSVSFKIFIPLTVAIGFFISLRLNFAVGQYRNLWMYSIVMSVYYFSFSLASIITPMIGIHLNVDIGSRIMVYFAFSMLCFAVALSPIILWYFDRDFYQETVEQLKYKLGRSEAASTEEFNEIVFDEEKGMHNVDIA